MRSVRFSLTVLILFAGAAPVQPEASQAPDCREHGRGVRICTALDTSMLNRLGRSTTWRIWVEGGSGPIQVRLHNSSPRVVRLKGGDDQVIHLGCLLHRRARRKVTAIGPGEAKLMARPYSPSPRQEAAAIAAALAPRLAQIEAEFIQRRAELPVDYSAQAVLALLDTTEEDLLEALNYQDLAALRDYAQEKFRRARAALGASQAEATAAFTPLPRLAVVASLSALRPAFAATDPQTESVLDQILKAIRRLRQLADEDALITDLCVTSAPGPGASFRMRPRRFDKWRGDKTDTRIPNLYRGIYIYRISKGLRSFTCSDPESCNLIDLVDDTRPVLHCNLKEDSPCGRQEEPCNGTQP